jgi:hypothetical protein
VKAILTVTVLLLCVSAFGQLEIRVPQLRNKKHDSIDVVIANTSAKDLSFCVEYGHWSFRDADHIETGKLQLSSMLVSSRVSCHCSQVRETLDGDVCEANTASAVVGTSLLDFEFKRVVFIRDRNVRAVESAGLSDVLLGS